MRIPLDHAAFLTWDTAATHDFYTKVMGWPLVVAWGRPEGCQRRLKTDPLSTVYF
jgi:catechol 2,3-dioxygenase-like lactoylglutathione lyase family enzyme